MGTWGVLLGALLLTPPMAGCNKLAKKLGEKAAQEVQEATKKLDDGPDAGQQTLGLYARGFNLLIDDPQECLTEYFDDVSLDGPLEGKVYRFFPAQTRGSIEITNAKKSFKQAAAGAPASLSHLEALGTAAIKNLEEACSTFAEVHKYYDAEDFKDDQGKKGKALHSRMVKLAESTQESMKKLEMALSKIEEEQSKKELAEYEKNKSYSYWFRLFSFESKKLLGVKDPKEFQKRYAAVDQAYEGLKSFATSKGDATNAAFKSFMSQADRFHSTAKKMSRALEKKEPNAQKLDNMQNQLTNAFNTIVSIGNTLRELEANDLLK